MIETQAEDTLLSIQSADPAPIAFEETTDAAGVTYAGRSYGSAWGDFNGDGLPDLWVNNHFGSDPSLHINNGDGTFTDAFPTVFEGFRFNDLHGAAWADFDNDGDQDLVQLVAGEDEGRNVPPRSEPNQMYVNEGGILVNRAAELGLEYDAARAQTPVWFDYDNDGLLDLFHTTTTRPDGLTPPTVFRQTANGFEDVGAVVLPPAIRDNTAAYAVLSQNLGGQGGSEVIIPQINSVYDTSAVPFESIESGVLPKPIFARDAAVADFNNDLLPDIYLARPDNDRLFLSNNQGTLDDWSAGSGINNADNSDAVNVVTGDFDNDMDVDIYVVRKQKNSVNLPNLLYQNQGDGTFVAVSGAGGATGTTIGDGDTVTTADYDLDGFLDLFVTNGAGATLDGPHQLFRNQGNSNRWIEIDLEGVTSNRDGVGAQVFVTAGGVTQLRQQSGGVHKWAQNHQRLHFGLGANDQIDLIEIRWPSGTVQQIQNVTANQVLNIAEDGSDTPPVTPPVTPPTTPSTIRIEAEDYRPGGQGVGYSDNSSKNIGGAYRDDGVDIGVTSDEGGGFNVGWISPGEWLTYDLDVPASGNYSITARVATPETSPREMQVSVGGTTTDVSFGSTGGWDSWQDVEVGNFSLAAGPQQLRIDMLKGKFNLNYLELKAASAPEPPASMLKIEAEDYLAGGQGVAYFDTTAGNSGGVYRSDDVDIQATTDVGGGFNVGWTADGEWLTYSLDVLESGYYDIVARVSSLKSTPHTLQVTAGDEVNQVSFGETGGWQQWQDVVVGNVSLAAGSQQVRVDMLQGQFNLNYLELQATAPPAPIRVEAEDYLTGGQGVGYFDTTAGNSGGVYRADDVDIQATTDVGGGFNVGWTADGEWLTYDIDVLESGNYQIVGRVASLKSTPHTLQVSVGGEANQVSFGATGSWQSWQDVVIGDVSLAAGSQQLRVDMLQGQFNLNYVDLVPV